MPRSAGKPIAVRGAVTIRAYPIVARAVAEEMSYGITRLWKYHDGDTMTEAQMRDGQDHLIDAVLNGLCDVLDFGDE